MEDPPQSLPDDVVEADVLRRLPPWCLAVSRSVCKAWRAAIDSRLMLRPDLLPLSVGGIFISLGRLLAPPLFFAPPPSSAAGRRKVDSKLQSYDVEDCDDDGMPTIFGCCNGLLLLAHHVVNPATRRSARVAPCPAKPPEDDYDEYHLLFDHSLSPQYEVVVIQDPHDYRGEQTLEAGSEWPPSPCIMWVYSSATGRWEKRPFAREGGAAGTLGEVQSAREPEYRHAVYCHGALYAHCKGDFIMRITLSDYKYQVIKLPEGVNASVYFSLHLVKSKYGVYLAYIHGKCQLWVWFLNEFRGETEWVLKYDINLQPVDAHFSRNRDYPINGPCWIIHGGHSYSKGNKRQAKAKNKLEWDFDKGNIIKIEGADEKCHGGFASILGLHPYKELAFLWLSKERVVACHLDGSKVQDLGHFDVPHYGG